MSDILLPPANSCFGCGACRAVCRQNAIEMRPDRSGFLHPIINAAKCTRCNACKSACPANSHFADTNEPVCYIARCRDDEVRLKSSSGGLFPLFASSVINDGGVVFGAAFDEQMRVVHRAAETLDDLEALTKTKYVQSDTADTFRCVDNLLRDKRRVFYVGTPCQIDGLLGSLGQKSPLLLTASLICYGAPSPKAWQRHVRKLEKRFDGALTDFFFRDKRLGDNGHSVSYTVGGREISHSLYEDSYLKSYFHNEIIRPVCAKCPYCTPYRRADITLGDFWGETEKKDVFADGYGVSCLLIHTLSGAASWEAVREQTLWTNCRLEDVLQPRLRTPTVPASACLRIKSRLRGSIQWMQHFHR